MAKKIYCHTCGQYVTTTKQQLRDLLGRVSVEPQFSPSPKDTTEEMTASMEKVRDDILETLVKLIDERIDRATSHPGDTRYYGKYGVD